jgi:hypothetical protein
MGRDADEGADIPRCCSSGHRQLPAAALGIFDDGEEAEPDVPYCAECARALIGTGEYTVTRVLDADALGSVVCPRCSGAGRIDLKPGSLTTRSWAAPPRPFATGE